MAGDIFLTLFPPGVAVAVATEQDADQPLHPHEAAAVARAVPRRRREFTQGRSAARRAMASLGIPPHPLPARDDRVPEWPRGVVGSITHTAGRCAAAVAHATTYRGLGLDVERIQPLEPGVRDRILTPEERDRVRQDDDDLWPLVTFGAKEAFYKAWYPLTGRRLVFHDVAVEFDEDQQFRVEPRLPDLPAALVTSCRGRWARDAGWVYAAAWVSA